MSPRKATGAKPGKVGRPPKAATKGKVGRPPQAAIKRKVGRPPIAAAPGKAGRPPMAVKPAKAAKSLKVVDSVSGYISFSEVALDLSKKKISIPGYQLTKMNRAKEIIGNTIVIARFLDGYNPGAETPIPWGEIVGYGGVGRKVKCIKRSSLAALTKAFKSWSGKAKTAGTAKGRRRTYKVLSDFPNF